MADEIDQAQAADQHFREAALAEHLPQKSGSESLTHCVNCEQEIPQARREAVPGCTRCVRCQESYELLIYWRN